MEARITLRTATEDDLQFLFSVSTAAMRKVVERLHPGEISDCEEELQKYKGKFDSTEIQVIQYNGQNIGRLRVVRSPESIYFGGIQILPTFQKRGIGTAIFTDLIEESKRTRIPITLEVHDVNTEAFEFYKKLGFIEVAKHGNKTVLKTVIG